MKSSLLIKLAQGFGANAYSTPFSENRFDWNNLFQQPQAQQGNGNGGMGALGMLALPFLMGGFGNQEPQDNRTNGQRIMDAGKGAWDATKGAVQFAGENLTPTGMATGLYDMMANSPKTMSDGWNQAWNGQGMGDVGMGALQMALPAGVAGLAGYGAYKGLKNGPAIQAAMRTANPASGFIGRGATWAGSQLARVPGLARLGGAGAGALGLGGAGMLSRAAGVAGLAGTGYNAFTRQQNPDYGYWGNAGLEAANTLGGIASGWQTAGLPGAIAGAGTTAAGNLYRVGKEGLGLMDDWKNESEAAAGADMWQNRVNMQNKLRAQLGEQGWKQHVQTQRAAGRKSWEAPTNPTPQPAPTPAAPAPAPNPNPPAPKVSPASSAPGPGTNTPKPMPKTGSLSLRLGQLASFGC